MPATAVLSSVLLIDTSKIAKSTSSAEVTDLLFDTSNVAKSTASAEVTGLLFDSSIPIVTASANAPLITISSNIFQNSTSSEPSSLQLSEIQPLTFSSTASEGDSAQPTSSYGSSASASQATVSKSSNSSSSATKVNPFHSGKQKAWMTIGVVCLTGILAGII